jgi:aminobenzoyl-glutamate utilization protein B
MKRKTKSLLLASVALGLLPVVASAADEKKQLAWDTIDKNAQTMADVGDSIYWFGELGMQEVESTKLLKDTLDAAGFKTELGGAGMPTNLWAEYGSGHPRIVIVTEIDALPGGSQTPDVMEHKPVVAGAPGHMEGHNTHGAVATAAAFAVKQVMEKYKLPGSVAISFGPSEETLISRPYIVRAGYFKDADAALYLHIGYDLATGYGLANYAAISSTFTFHGKTAHAAVDPWDGKDAVDAVELMDIGFAKLREKLHPTYRAHRTITMGGIQPNIIADTGQIWWFVRDANMPDAKQTYDKLVNVAKGAALMTQTTYDEHINAAGWPQLGNKALAEVIQKNAEAVGDPKWSDEEQAYARKFQAALKVKEVGLTTKVGPLGSRPQSASSNDSGDVSWVVPAGIFSFPAAVPGIQFHNWQAGVTPVSSIAHKGEVAGAKTLAATIIDLMTSPDVLKQAKTEFDQVTTASPYFAVLPADAKPPLDLNKAMMQQFRPEMAKYYLHKTPRYN